ncbi:MAG: glycosyltransferase family 4 protein [Moraxellaceae bacterium]|nr:glycosyltransferase family 4 protein [Moraxellaceae bacterium]
MKILLAQNASYCPALGGANRSNRTLLESLARLGHHCEVVATAVPGAESAPGAGFSVLADDGETQLIDCQGIAVHAVRVRATLDSARLRKVLLARIAAFQPDRVLVSTEDVGQVLLEAAVSQDAARVVYLARTTLYLPFGPDCFAPAPERTALLHKVGGIAVVGDYLKDYFRQHAGLDADVLPISLFGEGPFPDFGNFEDGFVTLVNPCAYKGLPIFLALADAFPTVRFAAVPTWGTTSDDLLAMKARPNISVLEPVEDMDRLFARSRVMLVPSLWAEAKSRTIVEAMLRGIPVMASDVGGNPEAKLGVDYVLPVNPLRGYHAACDERSLPVADVPPQDVGPWRDALARLLGDRAHYEEVSARSRRAAHDYLASRGGSERVAAWLATLPTRGVPSAVHTAGAADLSLTPPPGSSAASVSSLAQLSPAQRALLAQRLRQRSAATPDTPKDE